MSILAVGGLGQAPLHATSATWTGSASGIWNSTSNWSGSNIPGSPTGSTTDTAAFNATSANQTITVDSGRQVAHINFATGTGAYIFNGGPLIFTASFTDGIQLNGGTNNQTFNVPITTNAAGSFGFSSASGTAAAIINGNVTGAANGANQLWIQGNGSSFSNEISGVVANGSGTGSLTIKKASTGNWTLSGANTYTGGTLLLGGTVRTGNASALGTGAVTQSSNATTNVLDLNNTNLTVASLNSGISASNAGTDTITPSAGGTGYTSAPTVTISGGGGSGATATATISGGAVTGVKITNYGTGFTSVPTITISGGGGSGATASTGFATTTLNLGSGTLTIAGTNVSPAGYSGKITGTGNIIKSGAGVQSLAGATSTYTGTTTVSAGTLVAGADVVSTTVAASTVTANNATDIITLSGNTLVNGNQIVFAAGTIPAGLTAGTVYFVINQSGNNFQVSTTSGGSAVNFTTNGATVTVTRPGAFGATNSAIVLGDSNTSTSTVSLLSSGAFVNERPITVNNFGNGTTIGGSNTSGTASYSGSITLNKAVTLSSATGGTVDFNTGTWTTNNNAITIGSSGNTGTVQLSNAVSTTSGVALGFGTLALNSVLTGNLSAASGTTLGGTGSVSGTTTVSGATVNGTGLNLAGGTTFNGSGNVVSGTVTTNATVSSGATVSVTGTLTGTSSVSGTLKGTGTTGAVAVNSGGLLTGTLTTGAITGTGTVAPGNSPGILTASSATLGASGESFAFELTASSPNYSSPTGSLNDVLRLTSGTPLNGTATSANIFNVYFDVSSLTASTSYQGGIFTDNSASFTSAIAGGTYNYYVLGNGSGTHTYNGVNYYTLGEYDGTLNILLNTALVPTANFGSVVNNGFVMEFDVATVPEPGTWAMMLGGLALLITVQRRRKLS